MWSWISGVLAAGCLMVGALRWMRERKRHQERQEALLARIHYHAHSLHLMGREVYRRVLGREPPQPPTE